MENPRHIVHISIGSNIDPESNFKKCFILLGKHGEILRVSNIWETEAVGSDGPNFLNAAIEYCSSLTRFTLKDLVLHPIEDSLGRVRTIDKNAPRPLDLDIILYDGQIVDTELWSRLYLARPFSELLPDLINPNNGNTLLMTADELQTHGFARLRSECKFS